MFFGCDWGVQPFTDPGFGTTFRWDVPLLGGYEHEFLEIARRPRHLGFLEVDNPGVDSALGRFAPDVVLVHGYGFRTAWRAVRWARRHGRPVMLFSDSNDRSPVSAWKRLLKEPVVRAFYRRVDGALCIGERNRAYHRRYGVPEERLFRGALPIDRQRFLASVPRRDDARQRIRSAHGLPRDAFVVLYCGKLEPRKRVLDLLAASAELAERGLPIRCLVVGDGVQRGEIEEFVRSRHEPFASLVGFVNQSALGGYYAASDALALPSEYEPFGLVVTEAAAFGLPVVVSERVGCVGVGDVARAGENAFVHPVGDRRSIAEALAELIRNPARCAAMQAASARIAEGHDAATAAALLAEATGRLAALGPRQR